MGHAPRHYLLNTVDTYPLVWVCSANLAWLTLYQITVAAGARDCTHCYFKPRGTLFSVDLEILYGGGHGKIIKVLLRMVPYPEKFRGCENTPYIHGLTVPTNLFTNRRDNPVGRVYTNHSLA